MIHNNAIYFYNLSNKYGFMSNFYKCKFHDSKSGHTFNCSEQYFMYYKCLLFDKYNVDLLNKILTETSATKIKKYGRLVQNFDDKIWDLHKFDIMTDALRLKFSNIKLQNLLLDTDNKILYEASKNDKIWGIGYYDVDAIKIDPSKYGQNLLGQALMKIRSEIVNNIRNDIIDNIKDDDLKKLYIKY